MATSPFLPDETKPGASDLISLFPSVEQTFRDVIESWILIEHNTDGTHKQVTLDDISTPTIAADLVGIWHESGVLKTRFATGDVADIVTSVTGLLLAGGTMTGDLVLAGAPDADLKAATKLYVDDADDLKANLVSPTLTGNPIAPTPSAGDDDQSIATTAFVNTAITAGNVFANQLLHLRDQKSSGTEGGDFTTGAWRKRTLNTAATTEITGATLTSSVISLPAGIYYIDASTVGYRVSGHKARLYNTSDSALVIMGTTEYAQGTDDQNTRSFVAGRFTLAATKNLELQHRCSQSRNVNGLGRAIAMDGIEVFSDVKIWKVG